jgi:hypothetical protein
MNDIGWKGVRWVNGAYIGSQGSGVLNQYKVLLIWTCM